MREKALYQAVDRRLPRTIFRQSMTGASLATNGLPDRYYDGLKADLWVEWKQFDHMPRGELVSCAPKLGVKKQPKGHLTQLQEMWLSRRNFVGNNAVVIAGLPNKTAVIMTRPNEWLGGVPIAEAKTIEEIAAWICAFCGDACNQQSR